MFEVFKNKIPKDKPEIVGARWVDTKLFDLGDNKVKLLKSSTPVHYLNNGAWEDIDTNIEDKGSYFGVDKAWFDLVVQKGKIGYEYTSKSKGSVMFELIEINDTPISSLILNVKPTVEGNKLFWRDVVSGLDFYIEVKPARIRVWKVIKDTSAPHSFKWKVTKSGDDVDFNIDERVFARDNMNIEEPLGDRAKEHKKQRNAEMLVDVSKTGLIYEFREEFTGRTASRDVYTRVRKWVENETIYPVLIDQDITENIVANDDDGFEGTDAPVWFDDYGGIDYFGTYAAGKNLNLGIRFQGIAIPQGATIDDASLYINIIDGSGVSQGYIYGDDVTNAPSAWSSGDLPSGITKTTAKVQILINDTGTFTHDVAAIIQEIVSLTGWSSGNNLRFAAINTGTGGQADVGDYAGADGAVLEINFTAAAASDIKKLIGVAQANLKVVAGVAEASIKKVAGVSNV